jgi:hypothetical protein
LSRLDLALARSEAFPNDPVAAHELSFCLALLASEDLPSGLGFEVDRLIAEAVALARSLGAPGPGRPSHAWWVRQAEQPASELNRRLRSKLLDITAAISILARD